MVVVVRQGLVVEWPLRWRVEELEARQLALADAEELLDELLDELDVIEANRRFAGAINRAEFHALLEGVEALVEEERAREASLRGSVVKRLLCAPLSAPPLQVAAERIADEVLAPLNLPTERRLRRKVAWSVKVADDGCALELSLHPRPGFASWLKKEGDSSAERNSARARVSGAFRTVKLAAAGVVRRNSESSGNSSSRRDSVDSSASVVEVKLSRSERAAVPWQAAPRGAEAVLAAAGSVADRARGAVGSLKLVARDGAGLAHKLAPRGQDIKRAGLVMSKSGALARKRIETLLARFPAAALPSARSPRGSDAPKSNPLPEAPVTDLAPCASPSFN